MAKTEPSARRIGRALIVSSFAFTTLAGAACFSGSTNTSLENPYRVPDASEPTTDAADAQAPDDATARVDSAPVDAMPPVDARASSFAVGGNVIGLLGTGLVLSNGADTVTVNANGAFTLPLQVASGAAFDIEVQTNPAGPAQTCTVSGGSGTVGTAPVTSVVVNCATNTYVIGGTVENLVGSGLVLLNGSDAVSITATGGFAFTMPVASGGTYGVTVGTQPTAPSQTCSVASGGGTVASANVTTVDVSCSTNTYAVGGTVTGLSGAGLTLALQDGAGMPLSVAAVAAPGGTFSFPTAIVSGDGYKVVVQAQPTGPTQVCQVSSGASGTVTSADAVVAVTCQTAGFTVGGTISGLAGTGLVLSDNGGDLLHVAAGATSFTFATSVLSGRAFDVEVATSPTGLTQTCTVAGNAGTVGSGAVTSVTVNCGTNAFAISGSVTNLVGSGLKLTDGTDTISVTSGTFSFPALPSGTPYTISVAQQPATPTQKCSVTAGGTGTIGGGAVAGVTVSCTTSTFPLSVAVTGLSGSKTALTVGDGVDSVDLFADGTTQLPTALASGTSYTLTLTQPTMPWKTCSVTTGNGAGTVGSAAIAIGITCTLNTSKIAATVTGLIAPKAALQISDGVDTLSFSANGRMAFPTAIASGDSYAITVTNPAGPPQTCIVTSKNASGTVTTGGAVAISVACSWSVTVVVWGQAGGCDAFTLSDGNGQMCDLAASTPGGEQSCVFAYSAAATYEVDGDQVLNSATGGLCSCFQSDASMSTQLPELAFVNGTDGSGGFVFTSGAKTGVTTVYTYCQ